jgi:pseudaminic acid cytidylyltransferase
MIVAVIPARGGSKRIPRKNIRLFAGKPVIAYPIAAARHCGLFDRVIVTTDDEEIASVARVFGAETPFMRPAELADDHTGTNEVTAHALEWLAQRGTQVSIACCIYPTAPLVTEADLRQGYDLLIRSGKTFVFSAGRFSFPIQRAVRITHDGGVAPFFPEWIEFRSQDLEASYHDAGAFYWGRAEAFRNALPLFASHSSAFVLPRCRVQDIDTLEDWEHAERLYAALQTADRTQPRA